MPLLVGGGISNGGRTILKQKTNKHMVIGLPINIIGYGLCRLIHSCVVRYTAMASGQYKPAQLVTFNLAPTDDTVKRRPTVNTERMCLSMPLRLNMSRSMNCLPPGALACLLISPNTRVTVRIEEESEPSSQTASPDNPMFGIWRDREEMADVDAYVRKLHAPRYQPDASHNDGDQ